MRHTTFAIASLAALALTGCATVMPAPTFVARGVGPDAVARQILRGVQEEPELTTFDRDMSYAPDGIVIRLIRSREDEGRDVLSLKLVGRTGGTAVFVAGWHEDAVRRRRPDRYLGEALSTLQRTVRAATGSWPARLAER